MIGSNDEPTKPRVLLVDDEPAVPRTLCRQLEDRYDISVAFSGPEALRVIAANDSFSVVVSDMQMPGMDGAALLARIRRIAPATSRILLTGYADLESVAAAINTGAVMRFLPKPCSTDRLVEAIDRGIEAHRTANASDAQSGVLDGHPSAVIDSISHQVRTPLAAVAGLAEQLRSDRGLYEPAELDELLAVIAAESRELSTVIEDLVLLARARSGELHVEMTPTDTVDVIRDSVPLDLVPISVEPAPAWADPYRLRQAIERLVRVVTTHGSRPEVAIASVGDHIDVAMRVASGSMADPLITSLLAPTYRSLRSADTPDRTGFSVVVAHQLVRAMGGELTFQKGDDRDGFVVSLIRVSPQIAMDDIA